ncbi:MAG: heme-binding domain-containing protein [Bacteroidetes bacterium]|nr:heme-binding domain-containing protein [Bacteroidota bacterium]
MKLVKKIAIILLVVFVGIQFIPTKHNQSNLVPASDFMVIYNIPEQIETQLKVSCYDCHSNNTEYPWYNKIQPAAWVMEGHIKKGKEELNFNEFGDYSIRRQKSKLKSIISQIRDDEMPISSYAFMHGDAKLSESKKLELENWLTNFRDSL